MLVRFFDDILSYNNTWYRIIPGKKSLKIRIRKSKKTRQHNDQKKKDKRTNNDLQNITHKAKDRVTRTPLKTGSEFRCSGRVGIYSPLCNKTVKHTNCSVQSNVSFQHMYRIQRLT